MKKNDTSNINTKFSIKDDSPIVNAIMAYLFLFFVPVILAMGLGVYYQSAELPVYKDILCFPEILFNGLAACTFYFYLSRTKRVVVHSSWMKFLFSYAFALSSFLLAQEHEFSILALYALFPLLFLFFEQFLAEGKSLPLVVAFACCMMIDIFIAGAFLFYFAVLYFFETSCKNLGSIIADFLHFVALAAFAFLLSGFITIPRIADHIALLSENAILFYRPSYPFLTLFSRFLVGSVFYQPLGYFTGVSLYMGLFTLLTVFAYFANPAFTVRERLKTFLFIVFMLVAMELVSVREFLNFRTSSATITYSTFFLFIFIRVGIHGLCNLNKLTLKRALILLSFAFLFISLVFTGTAHNFPLAGILGNYLFLLLYGVLLLLSVHGKPLQPTVLQKAFFAAGLLELVFHAYLCTNASLVPDSATALVRYIWEKEQVISENDVLTSSIATPPYSEEYDAFWEDAYAKDFINLMNQLKQTVPLSKAEIAGLDSHLLPSTSETYNFLCKKVGAADDLLTPVENLEILFDSSSQYAITDNGHSLYGLFCSGEASQYSSLYAPCHITIPQRRPVILIEDYSGSCFLLEPEASDETFVCYFRLPVMKQDVLNFRLLGYYLNEDLLEELPKLLDAYEASSKEALSASMLPYYIGVACTVVGVFLLLCFSFNKDKEKLIAALTKTKEKIAGLLLWQVLARHFKGYYVYYLALLLPFGLILTILSYLNCEPFGPYSLLDQDGISSILTEFMNCYNNLKAGNYYINWNTGFGASMFPVNIFRFLLLPFKFDQISTVMVLSVGGMMSLSSLSMVYYLTHRIHMPAADKSDIRLLAPAFIYALNSFMIAMNGYVDWFTTFMVLPLIFLSLEYLVYRKKWLSYVLLLSFCMYMNIQLALYICIALFLVFFTFRFDGIKDFFRKGIRFALCSILCACNAFVTISGNFLYAAGGTTYESSDSVAPTFHFFGSFLDQWKNLMIFSNVSAVSTADSHINIYMGIVTMFLVFAAFCGKRVPLKQKLLRLLMLGILLFSFNELLTAYVINGFHYQSNVPNRHVFLFTFLCAVIAYDGFVELTALSRGKLLLITALLIGFFSLCQFASEGNVPLAFYATIAILLVCGLIGIASLSLKARSSFTAALMVVLLFSELSCNMFYVDSRYSKEVIRNFGDYAAKATYNNEVLDLKETGYRAITPSFAFYGNGSYTNTPGVTLFSPYISPAQKGLAMLCGYFCGTNYIVPNYDSTPFGNSLACVKYLFVRSSSLFNMPDLKLYNYIGKNDELYLFENPWVFPIGFYAPKEMASVPYNEIDVANYANWMAYLYCGEGEPLFDIGVFNEFSLTGKDVCQFRNKKGELISADEALAIVEESLSQPGNYFPIQDLSLDVTICPPADGYLYLYNEEFVSLGEGEADTLFHTTLKYPNPTDPQGSVWMNFHPGTMDALYAAVMEHPLENIVVKDNHITGVTNYEQDGYTLFSLPYNASWKAYIDGKEAAVINPVNAFLLVETPAGNHTLELVYTISPTAWMQIGVSIGSLIFTFVCYAVSVIIQKRRSASLR